MLLGAHSRALLYRYIDRVCSLPRRRQNDADRPAARETGRHDYVYLIESRKRVLRSRERDLRILPANCHSRIRGPGGAETGSVEDEKYLVGRGSQIDGKRDNVARVIHLKKISAVCVPSPDTRSTLPATSPAALNVNISGATGPS